MVDGFGEREVVGDCEVVSVDVIEGAKEEVSAESLGRLQLPECGAVECFFDEVGRSALFNGAGDGSGKGGGASSVDCFEEEGEEFGVGKGAG